MRTLLLTVSITCFLFAVVIVCGEIISLFRNIDVSGKNLPMQYVQYLFMGAVCLWMRDDYSNEEENQNENIEQ